jgi:hypothetical protein
MAEQTTPLEAPAGTDGQVEYGAFYFRHDCGVPYERNEHWLGFFDRIADSIVREFHPTSVLDVGCAMGFLVEGLRKRGGGGPGVGSPGERIAQAHESIREYCSVGSLTEPLGQRYDLIACIEVLEHIPAVDADAAIANLCAATDRLLISTTPEDYGEASHINVQPPEVWSASLAREGFLRDLDHDLSYLTPWAAVYSRREEPLPETVRRYDRSWWRLRHEVSDVRASLLKAQDRLAELEGNEGESRPELLEELARSKEEILRLRDLLVGRDAELGAAKGRLAILEEHSRRLAGVAARIPIPGATRLVNALVRLLQGRSG